MRLLQQLLCGKGKHFDDDEDPSGKRRKQQQQQQTTTPRKPTLRETMERPEHGSILAQPLSQPLDLPLLLHTLTRRLKVQQAAILDLEGHVLHVTPDFAVSPDEGESLKKLLDTAPAPAASMWRFRLFGEDFRCFHCDRGFTVLGHSGSTVLTAHVTRKHIVVGLAPELVPGSCLHEMMQLWGQMEARGL